MPRPRPVPLLLGFALLLLSPSAPVAVAAAPWRAPAVCVDGLDVAQARALDGIGRERDTRSVVADSEIPAGAGPDVPASFAAEVPVWFHVIAASTRPRDGWVSDAQIAEQMAVLNRAFSGGYGGADSGFRFRLEGVTRTVNPEWFEMATFESEFAAKRALRRGDAATLNIYSNSGAGFLGWAYLPRIVTWREYQVLDGAVVHFDSMPGGRIRGFNLGHTATHEVGHWLGLLHTFEQGCTGHGDHVDDTPAQAVPTSGCPEGKDTCSAPGGDPVHNYMDYSTDPCYSEFTAGQAARTQAQYLHWRIQHGFK